MNRHACQHVTAEIIYTRGCPLCRTLLRPVAGGLGRMGVCRNCGYTGPTRIEQPVANQ